MRAYKLPQSQLTTFPSATAQRRQMAAPGSSGRCLYDILGVNRDCSLEEIRSAYRKLALRLHPDKVAQSASGSADHSSATAVFQELQHAYDVLRDPNERAWYDSHRSQILFASSSGGSPDNGSFASFFSKFTASDGGRSPMDNIGNIYSFFSPSAYSGFSDSGTGFFKVYGDLFNKIYANEVRFAMVSGVELELAPLIGNLDSSSEQWMCFYKYWFGFSTVIDFSWADLYDVREGVNRRVRREMEDLNNKARRKMRREYNDTVRSLAAFVKKRDKRVVEMLRKKKVEEEVKKEEQRRKKEEEKKKKEENARLYREAEWAEINEEDEEIVDDDWFSSGANGKKKSSNSEQELYCVVCSKKFKSEKQWKNHEQSKKHRDKVAELRDSLQDEDEALGINDDDDNAQVGDDITVGFDYVQEPSDDSDENGANELRENFEGGFVLQEEDTKHEVDQGLEDETIILEAMVSNQKSRMAASTEQSNEFPGDEVQVPVNGVEDESSMDYNPRRKGRRKALRKENHSNSNGCDAEKMDDNDGKMKESATNSSHRVSSSKKEANKAGKNLKLQQQQGQRDGRSGFDKDDNTGDKKSSKGKKQKV